MNRVSAVVMSLVLLMLTGSAFAGSDVISLAGKWDFQLDPASQGLSASLKNLKFLKKVDSVPPTVNYGLLVSVCL